MLIYESFVPPVYFVADVRLAAGGDRKMTSSEWKLDSDILHSYEAVKTH